MKIKKLLICLSILLIPVITFGAYNDVTLTTDTVINVNGVNLKVSGSSALVQSIVVNATNFTFVLLSGSTITITAPDRNLLSTNAASTYITSTTCTASDSTYTIKHASSDVDPITITVTPSSSICAPSSGTSGSSSHSSGGGGSSSVAPSPSPIAVAVVATTPAAGKAVFTRSLSTGSTGDDVKNLQNRLLSEGFLKGEATGYFGQLTKAAVKAYQAKHGIAQLGIVGPATRAELNKGETKETSVQTTSALMLQINALLKQVQELQAKLKAQSN